jgi:hypothetical protein
MSRLPLVTAFSLLICPFWAAAEAEPSPASSQTCFDPQATAVLSATLPAVGKVFDGLARDIAERKGDASQVYSLARQATLVERLLRLQDTRDESTCWIARDTMLRDATILSRVTAALREGNEEIGIAKLEDAKDQQSLETVVEPIAKVLQTVETMEVRGFD